jgi:RimJ/RimL family protein N-acetyltransferase
MKQQTAAESAAVRLRGVDAGDADVLTELLAGDTELALRTATMPIPYTHEDAHAFLRTADPARTFAMVVGELKEEVVGVIGMVENEAGIEIGYWVGRRHWGRGYATTALSLLISILRQRGIAQVYADVFPENPASARVLEKCGFERLGEIERHLPKRGGWRRLLRYGLRLSVPPETLP